MDVLLHIVTIQSTLESTSRQVYWASSPTMNHQTVPYKKYVPNNKPTYANIGFIDCKIHKSVLIVIWQCRIP